MRKLALTAHVAASVGWLGAVAAFLAPAISGLRGADDQRVRSAYMAMELTGWFVIVPLSVATVLLLLHMRPTEQLAAAGSMGPELHGLRVQLVADAGAAIVVLLVATALGVYKPRGLTPYGRRGEASPTPLWVILSWIAVAAFVGTVAVLHLSGRGLGGH